MRITSLLVTAFAVLVGCTGADGNIEDLDGVDYGSGRDSGTVGSDESGSDFETGEPISDGSKVGKGGIPFNPKEDGSAGVKTSGDGSIVIDPGALGTTSAPLIWVANSAEGTISKIDTRTMKELARYTTGPGGAANDPSRTTVSLNGDVVVVNRGGASATKIMANEAECTGPGTGTSKGKTDVRAWGDDKCVMWNTPFEPGTLGRAAVFDAEKGLDGELSTSVWVGLYTKQLMHQLDSKTGKILTTVSTAPLHPYGAAVDGNHHIWVRGDIDGVGPGVGYIDAGGDHKFTQIANPPCGYGISVDSKGRVFVAGWEGTVGCVARYTPKAGKWDKMNAGTQGRGIAVDGKGMVWFADTGFGIHQVDADTLALVKDIPLATTKSFVGMAIDFDGMIWAINQGGSEAFKIDPKTYATAQVPVGNGPYTYSDMTGYQLRAAAAPFGKYRHVFKGCGPTARWLSLNFKADVPTGTTVTIRARVSKDLPGLTAAAWTVVGKMPSDVAPIDLMGKLGDQRGMYLEVEFLLESISASTTPILSSIDISQSCPPS
ncbi:MAG: hypothetical protein ACXVEF_14575 [Polyangiales bacterium]